MGQSTPIHPLPKPQHDTAAEDAYNNALLLGANAADIALRESVRAHLTAYPHGVNDHHLRPSQVLAKSSSLEHQTPPGF